MTKETKSWILLLLLACVWGSSFILMKRGMISTDNEPIFTDAQVGALRMFIAGLVLLPFGIPALKKIRSFWDVLLLAVVGFCGNFFPAFLFSYAETGISSGLAGMLNSFTPIFTTVIGLLVFQNKITQVQVIGLLIGTIGIVFLVNSGGKVGLIGQGNWTHTAAVILATLFYGISLNTIKHKLQKFAAVEITSLAFTIVFLPAVFSCHKVGALDTLLSNEHAMEGLLYITVLSVFGTAVAVILFNKVIAMSSTLFASTVTYLIPIVAVLIGFFDGERITWGQVGAMFIVLAGVFVANYWEMLVGKFRHKH